MPSLESIKRIQFCVPAFLDSDTKYNERDISLLLRAIQGNEKGDRQKWFENVNSCRRRRVVNIDNSSLRLVFQTPDEFFVLQDRAFMSRMRTAITSRGMYIYDAFRALILIVMVSWDALNFTVDCAGWDLKLSHQIFIV